MPVNIVEQAVRAACQPADRRTPWEWAEDNFVVSKSSPLPGKWRSDNSPWVRDFMESFANNAIHTISILCSAQSSKTETMLALLCWMISEDPGPAMWVTSNEDEALKFCTERAMPSLKSCAKIRGMMPKNDEGEFDRRLVKSKEIQFPRMPLEFIGSNAEAKLQSKPRRWLFLDEVRNWPAGALPMVLKRTRAFWNARRVIISTPDQEHDSVHQEFLAGDQRHYYVPCPTCNHLQLLSWEHIEYETNEETKPNGKWDFDKLAETIRFKCENSACEQPFHKDHPTVRRYMARNGKWVAHNPKAPKNRISYTWNALLPPWVKWRDLVEEFLNAHKALEWGDHEPLKTFINESLGQPWEDRLKYAKDNFLEERKVSYFLRTAWEGEKRRLLAFDVQRDHFRFVCRGFKAGGHSRLHDYGKLGTWEEVRSKIAELGVDDENVMFDAAHRTTEVYQKIAESGYKWKPMWGDERRFFLIDGVRCIFQTSIIDPTQGMQSDRRNTGFVRPIRLISWSNPSAKDMLNMMMHGMGAEWEISEHVDKDYIDQMTAERREEVTNAYGQVTYKWNRFRRDNHYFDCESMIMVAAVMLRLVGIPETLIKPPEVLPPLIVG